MNEPPENEGREAHKQRAKPKHHELRRKILRILRQVFRRLERHNAIVTAFGTLVIAIFTVVLALATLELKKLGEKQAADTSTLASAALQQAETANKQVDALDRQLNIMSLDQRPWLSLDVTAGGPLLHDAKGWDFGISWHLPLKYRVKNVGKTPATEVAFFAHIVPVVTGIGGISIPGELERACVFWERMQEMGLGNTELVFPQEEWPEKQFVVHGEEAAFEAAKNVDGQNLKYLGQFLVIACVVYKPTFPVDAPYRTAKEYYVGDSSGGTIDLNGSGLSADNVMFGPNRTRGTLAR